ncbi:MAG TPA: DUF1343 domain-containing protein [Thermoanaerobaculia bacterium]|nr:DUF1343 domain-containing protein [Thermoanaerobaculia bacterium]
MTRIGTRTGLDRLLADPSRLAGRRYGLLAHGASLTRDVRPIHRALAASPAGPPRLLFGPEHGYYGIEQDMIAAEGGRDPWTGVPVVSLYGDSEQSLKPCPGAFAGLDLLVIDLQDVGARYYTYAATAVWAAEAAFAAGCEVWVLDRPNPLGGTIEGNRPAPGYESFVSAFLLPARHGLTLGELVKLEARRRGWTGTLEVWEMEGWHGSTPWEETGLPWIAPSPNMPTREAALIYPGGCLVEATELSEGRGTTRPFQLTGAPGIDPVALADRLNGQGLPGIVFLPTYFRPQFQKHRGQVCGGVELVVTDSRALRPYRTGVELLWAVRQVAPQAFAWREAPYEFVIDRPAIDLLTGGPDCRDAIDGGRRDLLDDWIASWSDDELRFGEEYEDVLLYPSDSGAGA